MRSESIVKIEADASNDLRAFKYHFGQGVLTGLTFVMFTVRGVIGIRPQTPGYSGFRRSEHGADLPGKILGGKGLGEETRSRPEQAG